MTAQRTVAATTRIEGHGLHLGSEVTLEVVPAPEDTGIVFVRTDLPGAPRVRARLEHLASRPRRTAIVDGEAEVHTIEHLMACFWALGIQNAEVHIDGPELPGLDGSALPLFEALREAGTAGQDAPARRLRPPQPVGIDDRDASVIALPGPSSLRVSYTLDYDTPAVPTQYLDLVLDEETFGREIAPARTFCLEEEAAMLRAAGLGKGASTGNTLVIGRDGSVIENELRFGDEFVRHKILDLVGDLYLLEHSLEAHVLAVKSGHGLNMRLARALGEAVAGGGARQQVSSEAASSQASTRTAEAAGARGARRAEGAARRGAGTELASTGTMSSAGKTVKRVALADTAEDPEDPVSEDGEGTSGAANQQAREGPIHSFTGPVDVKTVQRILPHRYPFLMVDRVLEVSEDGTHARAVKCVSINEGYFRGHFPEDPVMPGVLQIESMAQTAGILLLSHEQNAGRMAYLLSLNDVKFRRRIVPGEQIILEARLRTMKSRTARVDTRATVDGAVAAEAHIRYMLVEPD